MRPVHVAIVFLCCLSLMHLHSLFTISSQITFYSQVSFLRDASISHSESELILLQAAQDQLEVLNTANYYVAMAMMVGVLLVVATALLFFTSPQKFAPPPPPIALPPPPRKIKKKKAKKMEEKEEEGEREIEIEEKEEERVEEQERDLPEPPLSRMTPRPKHPYDMVDYKEKFEQLDQRIFDVKCREIHEIMYADTAPCNLERVIIGLGDTEVEFSKWGADQTRSPPPEKTAFTRDVMSRKALPPNPFGSSSTRIFRHQVIHSAPDWSSFECRTTCASVDAPFDFVCEDLVKITPTNDGNSKVTYLARVVFYKKPWMLEGRIRTTALDGMKLTAAKWFDIAQSYLESNRAI